MGSRESLINFTDKNPKRIQSMTLINDRKLSVTSAEVERISQDKATTVEMVADKYIRWILRDSGEDAMGWRGAILKNAWKLDERSMDNIYSRAVRYNHGNLTRYFLACCRSEREKRE